MALETKFIRLQFLRRNSFEILSITSSFSGKKLLLITGFLTQPRNRAGDFERLVWFTQVESRDEFYTVRKLEVSSF